MAKNARIVPARIVHVKDAKRSRVDDESDDDDDDDLDNTRQANA